MYAERYFPAEQKARVERISDNVRAALMKRVEAATWMSPATKASALSKLQTLYVGLGYPDQWEDDSSLIVDPAIRWATCSASPTAPTAMPWPGSASP